MTETPVENPLKICAAACGAICFFALMNLLVKLVTEDHSVPQALFFRNVLGLLPVLFLIWHQAGRHGDWSMLRTNNLKGHAFRGLTGVAAMGCFFWSFALLPLADATAIHFAAPLILTALSVPLLREKVGPHRWGAVIIGLVAVLFMLGPAGGSNMLGSLVAFAAAALSAFAMVAIRKLGRTEHALTIVFYFTLCATAVTFFLMLFNWSPLDGKSLALMAGIGLLGGTGQVLLTYAYAHAPAAFVSPFNYLAIVFAAGFDFLVWQYIPGLPIIGGSLVVIATGLYILFRETRKSGITLRGSLYGLQPLRPTPRDEAAKHEQDHDKAA